MSVKKFVKFKKKYGEGDYYIRKNSINVIFEEGDYVRLVTVVGDFYTGEELSKVLGKIQQPTVEELKK